VWLLKGEDLLAGALGPWSIGDWLPAALGEGLVRGGAGNPARGAGALVLAAYVALFTVAGARVVVRRDVI
jgi:hypothetical protein